MKLHIRLLLFLALLSSTFAACDNNNQADPCDIVFDYAGMYTNYADNVILPELERLQSSVNALEAATTNFTAFPDVQSLSELRDAFRTAWLDWQGVSPYNFGPAANVFLRSSVNNFPANVDAIESNIANQSYDFNLPDAYDKGFPALDYLLYGVAELDQDIVRTYTGRYAYTDYLTDVVADIKGRVDQVKADWVNGYRNSFVQNVGTAAGTSLSQLINQLNENYEFIKRDRIGLPSGVLTLDIAQPTEVEAYYSGLSLELAIAAVEASVKMYTGGSGSGLDDLLQAAEAMKGEESLDVVIQNQYASALSALQSLSAPLAEAVENDQDKVQDAYAKLSQQLVETKTDMPSVLCVAITYIDNPSDSD